MAHKQLAFPASEYQRRVETVRRAMAAIGADVLLVDCLEHMSYLFGYAPPAAIYQPALLPLEGEPVVIVRTLDVATLTEQSWVEESVSFDDVENPIAVLERTMRERGWSNSRVAIELDSHFLPAARFQAIQQALPQVTFLDFSRKLWELRLLKSEAEIALLRKAADVADAGMAAAIDCAGIGVSERECAAALYAAVIRAGADSTRSALIASGKRTASLHGRLGNHMLEPGDILHVESIPLVTGYGARLMRSTSIGKPDDDLRRAAETLIALQEKQFEAMKPGALASDVDRVLREAVLASGLRTSYDNVTGYTMGFVGLPVTSDFTRAFLPTSNWRLEESMVFHMYTYAQGVAFSDTVLVTAGGAERLTRTPRQLFVRS